MGNEDRYWRDPALGEPTAVETSGERCGRSRPGAASRSCSPGALVNANLWRKVVPRLAPDFRCVTLDLPLGSHELAMPGADLSPPASQT